MGTEQIILLLVIGLISLVNWVIQKSAEARKKRQMQERIDRGEEPAQPVASRRYDHHDEEPETEGDPAENMRRLMEALGLPLEDAPPQPVPRPQAAPPPLPAQPREMVQPPPLVRTVREMEAAGEMPVHRQPAPVVTSQPQRAKLHDWQRKAAKSLEASAAAEASRAVKPSRVRQMIQQPESLRDAVILTEILGRPRGFQE